MPDAALTQWSLKGTAFIACNCDFGCPCNFNARPTQGHCEGGWTWHVQDGSVIGPSGRVSLDGLNFSVYVKWPGAIHEGNGEGLILVDERADAAQREAIAALVGGRFGGPWGVLAWTWPTVHGPKPVPYSVMINGVHSTLKAGEALRLDMTTIRNPVTGAEAHPGIILPEGIILKRVDLGASALFKVDDAISLDHSGHYTAVGEFDYTWP